MTARTIVLLRHAKAETPDNVADIDRPLSPRGHRDAEAAGTWLKNRATVPDVVLCSPARRTRETWAAVASTLEATPEVRYEPSLYAGGVASMLDLIRQLPDDTTTVMVIGHNPTISDVALHLEPDNPINALHGLRTAGLTIHECTTGWADLAPASTHLVDRHTARG
jgi:phosphohistidine phosphatase